jgi:acetylornithine deacetylase
MAKYHEGVSALDEMIGLIGILKEYGKKLYEESKGQPLFPYDPLPVTVNVGQINGGDWPATVPAECWIEGGIGFLPNKRLHQIQDELRKNIEAKASDWAKNNYHLEFSRLHNDAYEMPVEHPVVKSLCSAADSVRGSQAPLGWLASCDARLYFHRGGMPTVVFGPGDLGYAHSLTEQIKVSDILRAAEIMLLFLIDWCGA